ncbi:MAG: ABC transporter ATP-binding protein [Syntrophobacteraceae bacterium]|nr:ABC transporter ATP-binding protein [Syntrophobacteraceae bacterium]
MEWKAAALVLLIQIMVSIFTYRRWKRSNSLFPKVRTQLLESLRSHLEKGSLGEFLSGMKGAADPISRKDDLKRLYIKTGAAMVLGMVVSFLTAKIFASYLVVRTIVCTVAIIPFIHFLTIIIAREADENRVLNFQQALHERIEAQMAEGKAEAYVKDLLALGISDQYNPEKPCTRSPQTA